MLLANFGSIIHSPSDPSFLSKKGIPLQLNSIEYVKFLANRPEMVQSFIKTVNAAKDRRELRQIVKDICADSSLFGSTIGIELAKKIYDEINATKENLQGHYYVPIENFESSCNCSAPRCSLCQANTDFLNFLKTDVGQQDLNFGNKSTLGPFMTFHKKTFNDLLTFEKNGENKVKVKKIKEKVVVLRDNYVDVLKREFKLLIKKCFPELK